MDPVGKLYIYKMLPKHRDEKQLEKGMKGMHHFLQASCLLHSHPRLLFHNVSILEAMHGTHLPADHISGSCSSPFS